MSKKRESRSTVRKPKPFQATVGEFTLSIEPYGPGPRELEEVSRRVLKHQALRKVLGDARFRLLSLNVVDDEAALAAKPKRIPAPSQFLATLYDYTNNRAIRAAGNLQDLRSLELTEHGDQPLPSQEEFDDAVRILTADREFGPLLRERLVQPYAPMPPLGNEETLDGRIERTINVGLLPTKEGIRHEIAGVNLIRERIVRYDGGAPGNSLADSSSCGIADANKQTVRSAAGQVWITVKQGNTTLWRFLAVRPAASSGTNGSGVELRYLDYRGKRVLYRAHVPILNVKYDKTCGPYRDWQNQEGMIQANGQNVAPGFMLSPAPVQTILDNGSDAGTFLGVGIYVQGLEVVLVSEMEAGWYRYVSEWRLHADGTIRPRFGFTAVQQSCVCIRHHHHAYWRLDFDIGAPGNNRVREFNDPPLFAGTNWHTKSFEIRRPRDPARNRKWRVENTLSGDAYDIVPGNTDGVATSSPDWPFPRGDVWLVRYRGSEIDDGAVAIGPPYEAGLDAWVNGESINGMDVVVWYAGHFTHDFAQQGGHRVGPDLRLVKW